MVKIKTLVVVDMQNDFVSGVFGTKEAKEIVDKVTYKMKKYLEEDEAYTNIVCTQDTHFPDTWEDSSESYLPVHCLAGTTGYELVDPIKELVEAHPEEIKVINKFTFGSIKTASTIKEYVDYVTDSLKEEGIPLDKIFPEIEIVGLCTDICVISNDLILKAMMPYADIYVDRNCCAGTTPENHDKAIAIIKQNGIFI